MVKRQEDRIGNRYDKTLKELLDNKTLMKELIIGFIDKDWVRGLDFQTLKKEKTDFLSEDLKQIDNLLSNILATDNKKINQESLNEIILKIKLILSGYDKEKELIMLDKINKFIKLISSDRIDIKEALKTLNEEDNMGGMMRLINELEKKGMEKGMEKGKIEAKLEFIKRMNKANINIKQISEISGFSVEEIQKILNEK